MTPLSSYFNFQPRRFLGTVLSILLLVTISTDGLLLSTPSISLSKSKCHWAASSTRLLFARWGDNTKRSDAIRKYVDDETKNDADIVPDESSLPTKSTAAHDDDPLSVIRAIVTWKGPPMKIDDTNVLLYDVILLMNLCVSISLFVTHRSNYVYFPASLNEGAVLSLCWITCGLINGAFLYSAIDGHYDPRDERYANKGGPKAAGLLAISTYVATCSLRIALALLSAIIEHRPVGSGGEDLIPLEIPFGLVLMSAWRTLHAENIIR